MNVPEDGLDIVRFERLHREAGLAHGIFGRAGGYSQAPWNSLNVGADVGDAPENVGRNYDRICQTLSISRADLVTARQVHSNVVARVSAADRGRVVGSLDGLVTDEPNVPLVLRFADCVPLLAYDPVRHVLGVAHAGWRGTVTKIALSLVQAMVEEFDSRAEDLIAGIGPSIGPCCYEVGDTVIAEVRSAFGPEGEASLLLASGGGTHFDLWAANRTLFERAGVAQIQTLRLCTSCHRERFFSHRADGGKTGRFAMVAMLRG